MSEQIPVQLAIILLLGIGSQWVAWRLKVPAILLLLFAGFAAGPALEWFNLPRLIDPDRLFGNLLLPVVSMAVAIVLFEGGLSLNFADLGQAGRVIRNLVTVGAAVTWLVAAVAAHLILAMPWPIAILLGAILIVTGPTVIGPMLRHIRPIGKAGAVLKWEGIVIDPIGAMVTVLVFEAINTPTMQDATRSMVLGMLRIAVVGSLVGALAARALVLSIRKAWLPDYLQNPITLTLLLAAFTGSNLVVPESGLFAVTVMGLLLGNQQHITVAHIAEFKENLTVLLISTLFIVLAGRLSIEQLQATGLQAILYTLVLIAIARPAAVALSTIGSDLSWRERVFLAWVAPRGIVAASVAALFALRLHEQDYPGGDVLVSATFTVIVGTVTIYGLTAPWLSKRLQLSAPNPGLLIAGANPLALAIAQAVQAEGHSVLVADSNFELVGKARLTGVPVVYGSVLSRFIEERIGLTGIGRLLALTPNEEANSLAALKFSRIFGRDHVFQLAPDVGERGRKEKVAPDLQGHVLFGNGATYEQLASRLAEGEVIKRTLFSDTFAYTDYLQLYGEGSLPLFLVDELNRLEPVVDPATLSPKPRQALISLVRPLAESAAPA